MGNEQPKITIQHDTINAQEVVNLVAKDETFRKKMLSDMKKKFLTEALLDERTSEICASCYVDNLRPDSLFPNEGKMKRQMHEKLRAEFPKRGFSLEDLQGTWDIKTKDWHSTGLTHNGEAHVSGDTIRFWEGECTIETKIDCGISTFSIQNPAFETEAMRKETSCSEMCWEFSDEKQEEDRLLRDTKEPMLREIHFELSGWKRVYSVWTKVDKAKEASSDEGVQTRHSKSASEIPESMILEIRDMMLSTIQAQKAGKKI